MKKFIPFIAFLLILSACSNWKYGGKSRVSGTEVRYAEVVIEKNKKEPLVIDVPNLNSKDVTVNEEVITEKQKIESVIIPSVKQKSNMQENMSYLPLQDKFLEVEDSLKKNDEIIAVAMKNERESKKSLVFGILSVVFSFTPIFILGFIFGIKGLRKSIHALDERYITPKGLKAAKAGLVLNIIGVVLTSLTLLVLLTIILLFIIFL